MHRRERKISNIENSGLGKQVSFISYKKHVFDFPPYEIMRTFYRTRRVHLFHFNLQTTVKGGGDWEAVQWAYSFSATRRKSLENSYTIM